MPAFDIAAAILAMPVDAVGGKFAKAIGIAVALRWADEDGRAIFAHADAATLTGFSIRTVGDAMRTLRERGVIEATAATACRFLVDRSARGADLSAPGAEEGRHAAPSSRHAAPTKSARGADPEVGTRRRGSARPAERSAPGAEGRHAAPTAVLEETSSLPPPPPGLTSKEEGDARDASRHAAPTSPPLDRSARGADLAAWVPSPSELKALAWIERHRLPLALPDGTDLRPEWVAAMRFLTPTEAEEIRARMVGELPSAFRDAAAPYEPIRTTRSKHAAALTAELSAADQRALAETQQRAYEQAQRERAENERKAAADRETQMRGPWLEQARHLVAEIDGADPRRAARGDTGWRNALGRLREGIAAARVLDFDLRIVRNGWPELKALALPAEPAPSAGEPYDDAPPNPDHPAAPDRDHPLVILDDDAPPVDEDPVVAAIRGFLGHRGMVHDPEAVDAWLAHLVEAGAALTSADADAYLDIACRMAAQRGLVITTAADVPPEAQATWTALAREAVAS